MMKDYGEVMTEKLVIEKVTSTLTLQFDHVIIVIQESIS